MSNCKTCKNAVFCETWGEWKCVPKKRRVYDIDLGLCTLYKEGEPKMTCGCETCQGREKEEPND